MPKIIKKTAATPKKAATAPKKPAVRRKSSTKTRAQIFAAIQQAVDSATEALSSGEKLNPKECRDLLALMTKAAEQLAKYAPLPKKRATSAQGAFTPTLTDKALLALYVERQLADRL